MTTYFRRDVTCVNCRRSSQHHVLGSTNAFGSPDLDLRPPEMRRSTMRAWLQRCPHCDYTAPDLSEAVGDLAVVSGSPYHDALNDERFPELARLFLAHALLSASADPSAAAHARLSAAWVCDDEGPPGAAAECRRLAAESFAALRPFPDDDTGLTRAAVFVDVLRRVGEFAWAAAECDELLARPTAAGPLRQVLEFQSRLIAGLDAAAHRVGECVR